MESMDHEMRTSDDRDEIDEHEEFSVTYIYSQSLLWVPWREDQDGAIWLNFTNNELSQLLQFLNFYASFPSIDFVLVQHYGIANSVCYPSSSRSAALNKDSG